MVHNSLAVVLFFFVFNIFNVFVYFCIHNVRKEYNRRYRYQNALLKCRWQTKLEYPFLFWSHWIPRLSLVYSYAYLALLNARAKYSLNTHLLITTERHTQQILFKYQEQQQRPQKNEYGFCSLSRGHTTNDGMSYVHNITQAHHIMDWGLSNVW